MLIGRLAHFRHVARNHLFSPVPLLWLVVFLHGVRSNTRSCGSRVAYLWEVSVQRRRFLLHHFYDCGRGCCCVSQQKKESPQVIGKEPSTEIVDKGTDAIEMLYDAASLLF